MSCSSRTVRRTRTVSSLSFLAVALVASSGALALPACSSDTSNNTTIFTADGGGADSPTGTVDGGADGTPPTGSCGFGEPNETRETAKAVAFGDTNTACISAETDVDYLEVTSPADATGGFMQLDFTNVGTGSGSLKVRVFTASDNAEIASKYVTTAGESIKLWVALAPATKYRIEVTNFASFQTEYKYDLKATYTKVNDTFEPNDRRDDAKPLTLGAAVSGYIFAGFKGGTITEAEYDDWYSVTLADGFVTAKVENVPADVTVSIELYDPSNATVDGRFYSTTAGASVTAAIAAPHAMLPAGAYKVRVNYFSPEPASSGSDALPEHLTKPYKLTVTQQP